MTTTNELTLMDICRFTLKHNCEISVVKDPDGDPNIFGVCLYYEGLGTIATFYNEEAEKKSKDEWIDFLEKMLQFVKDQHETQSKEEVDTDD